MIMRRPFQEVFADFYLSWQAAKTPVICGHFVLCQQLEAWCCQLEQIWWQLGGTAHWAQLVNTQTQKNTLAGRDCWSQLCPDYLCASMRSQLHRLSAHMCVREQQVLHLLLSHSHIWRFACTHTGRHQLQLCGNFGLSLSTGSEMLETRLNPAPASNINTHRI